MNDSQNQCTVLYDGKCKFCRLIKRHTEIADKEKKFDFIDLWSADIKKFQLKRDDLKKEIHLISAAGKTYKGYEAMEYIIQNLSNASLLKLLFNIPNFEKIGIPLYRIISNSRF